MTKLTLTLDCEITLPVEQVDGELATFLRRELSFANPKRAELARLGYSLWKVPTEIKCYREHMTHWYLPIGFGPKLWQYLKQHNIEVELVDKRVDKPVTPLVSQIQLKNEQQVAKDKLLSHRRVILEAKPGFGKTMMAIDMIATRAQKTIIIVHTRALLSQWQKRISDFCQVTDGDIGLIGEGRWEIGRLVTVASYQTLLSRGTKRLKNEFGLVVVDECHHVPANTFAKVVRGFAASWALGLTATPYRKDKLDRLMNFYIGPIVPTTPLESSRSDDLLPTARVPTFLHWQPTETLIDKAEDKEFVELGSELIADSGRLRQIVDDVASAYQQGGKIIVLSERVSHAQMLHEMIARRIPTARTVLITGQVGKQEREELIGKVKNNAYQIMVATGGVVGEGFDWPAADYLFLTFPFSWRGKLIQYVGRVQRSAPGKESAHVYDYVDEQMGIFRAMARKRATAYRELGVAVAEREQVN